MLTDPDVGLIGQWEGVHAGNASPSFSLPVIAAILAASFLPVSVVLAVQRQRLLSLTVRMLVLVSSLHKCVLRRETGEADHFIMVAERLQQWRRTGISIAAVVVASFHLFELVRICFVADSVCMCDSSLSHLRLFLALVHLCNLWVASLFLALTHWFRWKGSCPDLTFLFVITVLDIAWTGLLGEQALLVESRLYRQVLWRLLLGACTSPIIALLGNLLCVLGAGTVYKVLIPDGFIFTVGSTRAGLLYSQGCNQLWSKRDAMVGKELLQDLSRFSDVMDLSTLPHLSALLDELLKKQTSFTDFLLSEVILCTIVMVALMCLDALMSQGISQSLRLESSEDQLLAVSQILDRLCDATCQLSGELQICSCSPKLGAILHMSSTAWRAIEGMDFCSLIPSGDDLARFRTFVDQGIRDGFQEALVLKLKGASGIKVRMQLLCAKFRDVLGRPRVLCGLTELQVNRNSGNVQDATDSYGPLVGPSSSRTARQRRRGSRSPGSSSGSGGGSGAESEESCAAVVRLAEDAAVLHANGAFLQFLGTMLAPFRAGGFQQFLAEPAVFAESVRSCAEGASSGGLEEPSAREIGVTFNVLAAESGHVLSRPSKAVCRVECCKSPEGDSITAKLEVLTATPPVSSSALARGSRSSRAERSGQEQRGADIAPLEAATKEPSPSIMGRTAL